MRRWASLAATDVIRRLTGTIAEFKIQNLDLSTKEHVVTSDLALPMRQLGTTGLRVHSLCIGCAALGNMPDTFAYEVDEERALSTLRAIFDGPVNFVDTAAAYG